MSNAHDIANRAAEIHSMHNILEATFDGQEDSDVLHYAAVSLHKEGFRPSDLITPTATTRGVVGAFVCRARDEIEAEKHQDVM